MKHDKGLYLFTTLILVAFGVCAWWLFYPYKPIVVDYIKIVDKEVLPGQPMTYEIKYHKKMAITGVLSRNLKTPLRLNLVMFTQPRKRGKMLRESQSQSLVTPIRVTMFYGGQ